MANSSVLSLELTGIPSDINGTEGWAASFDPSTFADEENTSVDPEEGLAENDPVPKIELDVVISDDFEDTKKLAEPTGTLDVFFKPDDDDFFLEPSDESITREVRSELAIQETLATILRATAMRRMFSIKEQWRTCVVALLKRTDGSKLDDFQAEIDSEFDAYYENVDIGSSQFDEMELDELESLCSELAAKLSEASKAAHDLDRSAKRIGSRVLDYSSPHSLGGRNTIAQQERLANMMDEYYDSLPEDKQRPGTPGSEKSYVFGSDEFDPDIDPLFGGGGPKFSAETDGDTNDDDVLSDTNESAYDSYLTNTEEYPDEETTDWETFESLVDKEGDDTHFTLPQIEPYAFFEDDETSDKNDGHPQDVEHESELFQQYEDVDTFSTNETSLDFNSIFE